ncbi:MAG: hypothetical protein Q4F69_10565, partial [Bacteroidia bacterium]|nr:hypothetical protein [Bacteroidia bacterium]
RITINSYAISNNISLRIEPNSTTKEVATISRSKISYPFYRNIIADTEINDLRVAHWYVDLTQMFGEGNEPTTVEEFKALYPNEYYEYVESRYEDTGGYYENGQVVEHIPDTAFQTPMPELPEEIRCVENPKIEVQCGNLFKLTSVSNPSTYNEYAYIKNGKIYAKGKLNNPNPSIGNYTNGYVDLYGFDPIVEVGIPYYCRLKIECISNPLNIGNRYMIFFGNGGGTGTILKGHFYADNNGYINIYGVSTAPLASPYIEIRLEGREVVISDIIVSHKPITKYIPFRESTTTEIPFKLYGANDINDECEPCVLVDGEWKCRVTRRWNCVTFDGTEGWFIDAAPIFVCKNRYLIGQTIKNVYNTYGIRVWFSSASRINIQVHTEDVGNFGTEQEWKDWIKEQYDKGTPLRAWYELETPIVELYNPIPVRTLPINSIIDCDAEMEANVKVVDK